MNEQTRTVILIRAGQLLREGCLPSALPRQLMDEYSLSAQTARDLAWAAVWQWREQKSPRAGSDGGKKTKKKGDP